MKLRYIVTIYTVFMLTALLFIFYSFNDSLYINRDMVYYNGQLKQIQSFLENGESKEEVEQKFLCSILFISDNNYIADLNRMLQERAVILDLYIDDEMAGKVSWSDEKQVFSELKTKLSDGVLINWIIILLCGYALLLYIYLCYIRPFYELKDFSSMIAKGNFDIPLPIHKNNFFGAFTESFDIMREELQKAKENEYRANRSKKELVAELSHDIKTPVSTIKAACEVIQVKEKNPDTLDKVSVIIAKADTIEHLIGNMFNAAMEELEVLKVEVVEESSLCIKKIFDEFKYYGDTILEGNVPECLILADKLRLEQVIGNIINNSYKYSGTSVTAFVRDLGEFLKITIKDKGQGVSEEELLLITEKYYRGSNAKGKSGSGLGLYLSKMFMERMDGDLNCYNDNGFVVEIVIKKRG